MYFESGIGVVVTEWQWSVHSRVALECTLGVALECTLGVALECTLGVVLECTLGVALECATGVALECVANMQINTAMPLQQWSGKDGVAMECTLHCHSSKLLEVALEWCYVVIKNPYMRR